MKALFSDVRREALINIRISNGLQVRKGSDLYHLSPHSHMSLWHLLLSAKGGDVMTAIRDKYDLL